MPTLDFGQQLPPDVAPFSQQYMDTAQKGYRAGQQPARKQAHQELLDELNTRGIEGGQFGQAVGEQRQNWDNQDAQFSQNLGLQGAQLGEQNRQREQGHQWSLEDRNFRAAQLREQMDAQKQAQQDQMWGTIAGGAASMIGGPVAGMAAKGLYDSASSSNGAGGYKGQPGQSYGADLGVDTDLGMGTQMPKQKSWGNSLW